MENARYAPRRSHGRNCINDTAMTEALVIRLSLEQKTEIIRSAEQSGLSIAAFIRHAANKFMRELEKDTP